MLAMALSQPVMAQNGAMGMTMNKNEMMETTLRSWPRASQMAARAMMEKYGQPAEMTESMMVWNATGQWKRTVVYKEEARHLFPGPHTDVMQQFVNYKVPPDMVDELARFDGSVVVNRTNGELSARCDQEAANILALNLAHKNITDHLSVDEARRMYGEQIMALKAGRPAPLTERLMFSMMEAGNTADPDKPLGGM